MNLQQLNPLSDCKVYNYDTNKVNWSEFWLDFARSKFPAIESLENVHQVLAPQEIVTLGKYCQEHCQSTEFSELADTYFTEIAKGKLGFNEFLIQRYFTIRIVIPNQAKVGRQLNFHQGIWVGNGLGLRTIWTPFTKAYDTNTMWIVDWDKSSELTKLCYKEKWSAQKLQDECSKFAKPATVDPGQCFVFQQHHLHGNYNNETDITRWSMDGRILPKGGHFHRKLPGGYFRFLGEREDQRKIDTDKTFVTYAGWNSKFAYPLPLPMQRAIINQYCTKYNIAINDYTFENDFLNWQPVLEHTINNKGIDAIILCSIYCLPDDSKRRLEILNLAVDTGTELHFANELCSVRTPEDIKHIERIFEYVNENTDPNQYLNYNLI